MDRAEPNKVLTFILFLRAKLQNLDRLPSSFPNKMILTFLFSETSFPLSACAL